MDELDIEYPCPWQYKIFGTDEAQLRAAVVLALGDQEHALDYSNKSSSGKYVSLTLELEVRGEADRQRIWDRLAALDPVLFLL